MPDLRMDLIDEYFELYEKRNAESNRKFRENYTRMSELWMDFNDKERRAVNVRMTQMIMPF